jgi:hypothetical protein
VRAPSKSSNVIGATGRYADTALFAHSRSHFCDSGIYPNVAFGRQSSGG